jgi:preprotein translocase subunit SecA
MYRLNYAFLAGQMLQDRPVQDVVDEVLDQLEGAQEVLRQAWGIFEWNRLVQSNVSLTQLDERLKARLVQSMGSDRFAEVCDQPLAQLTPDEKEKFESLLGWFDQNEAVRQLLLSVISDLWVDYLTRVEALRVSIGLEAYAQRDPLVQYKGRASEMFQQLLGDIRNGVISRLYSFRPRPQAPAVTEARGENAQPASDGGTSAAAAEPAQAGSAAAPAADADKKKKRKRH